MGAAYGYPLEQHIHYLKEQGYSFPLLKAAGIADKDVAAMPIPQCERSALKLAIEKYSIFSKASAAEQAEKTNISPFLEVTITAIRFSIKRIGAVESEFDSELELTMVYRDEATWRAFAFEPNKEPQQITITDLRVIPVLRFTNAKGDVAINSEGAFIKPESGIVEYTVSYSGTFSEIMELQRFPFDRQLLHINIQHDTRKQQNFRVTWKQKKGVHDRNVSLKLISDDREWGSAHPSVVFPKENLPDQELVIIGRAERFVAYFMWNIVFMMFLIVTMSFLTFSIPPEDEESRLSLNLTLVLTAVAYKYVIAGYLPKTTYLTLLDKYVFVAFIMLVSVTVENALVSSFESPFSNTIDHYTEWTVIPFWVVLHLFVFAASVLGLFRESWETVDASQETGDVIALVGNPGSPGSK
eukprot:TRINITY_DN3922_c0_g1_i3.p1 TRINITY_DN3922_c0_g1~~TRINITY_DN3922_c0_g1_i3.p1  ORF type:complete len:412 (-),score=78.42 TRINITY_DN3922_c0_g1_i3:74-1309(-)